ncbi:MAG: hypothetical protein KDB14_03660 [Planctomycetales bacterium]|nr:hypothetical protein [Planctomycetales bacterium]
MTVASTVSRCWQASLCAAALLLPALAGAEDKIYNLDGREIASGTVTSMSAMEVVVGGRAGDRKIPANEIQKILFDEDSGETRTVKTRVVNQQYDQAIEELRKISIDAIPRAELKSDMRYYEAMCLAKIALEGRGDKVAAGAALVNFINTEKRSYHLFEAAELMGDVSRAVGRFETAAQYYGYLTKAPWPEMQMRGGVLTAESLVAQENYKDAAAQYDSVLSKPNNDPGSLRQKLFAQLGKAYCLGMSGDPAQGIAIAEAVIKDNNPQDGALFGRAYNTLGVCHLKADRKKEALRAFLHTSLMFTTDPNVHAESLYYQAKLWEDLEHSERALQARALLKDRYATTSWGQK